MDAGLLSRLFGARPSWHGSCTVLLDADAAVKSTGPDSIQGGGTKVYSPRITSGRVPVDALCYLPDQDALLLVQRTRLRTQTGEDYYQQTLMVVDTRHVVGIEFEGLGMLEVLDIPAPALPEKAVYTPGTLVG